MKPYIMIDLETLDNKSTAAIVSIGAVLFNANGVAKDKFYAVVDTQSCIDKGLTVGGNTITWWAKQSDEARAVFSDKSMPLDKALQGLKNYIFKNCNTYNVTMVGNSARFDLGILENAFRACGQEPFWKFWNEACYRTWKSLKGAPKVEREGTHHNALDDAYSQAKHAIEINNHFGGIIL